MFTYTFSSPLGLGGSLTTALVKLFKSTDSLGNLEGFSNMAYASLHFAPCSTSGGLTPFSRNSFMPVSPMNMLRTSGKPTAKC